MRFAALALAALPLAMAAGPVLIDPNAGPGQPPSHQSPPSPHKPTPSPTHPSPPGHTTTSSSRRTTSSSTKKTTSSSTKITTSTTFKTSTTSTKTTSSSTKTTSSSTSSSPPQNTGSPAPSGVQIEGISYAGSGCNAGSVAGALSDDASTITLLYDSFVAQTGQGIQPSEARKNCQLNVQLRLPQGWQFSVFKADYRGYAYLQPGDTGVIKATYYFSGDSTQVSSAMTLNGAYDDNYLKEDTFGLESTVWSPCGEEGLLNINSEVRVTPANVNDSTLLTVDSTDLKFTEVHYLQWEQC
ncbi:hypothetical protein BX600DRAFT_515112 [Xylariales sp. PMI_506]|nr:hypothetical protein BX600DRAFT_515112 [Xylariales sp. PMI_506]